MMSPILALAIFATGAGLVSAQSISSACKAALAGIAASPDATYLNPSALLSLVLAGNSSIITPVDNWLKGLCAIGPCNNSSLSAIVTNLTAGCGTELSAFGSSNSASDLIPIVEGIYPTVRQIACLKDTSANQLCVTETLTDIQNVVGTLSLPNLPGIFDKLSTPNSLPSSVICTNCIKKAYNILNQAFPNQASGDSSALQSQCGSSFTDGSDPSGISEIASTSTGISPSASNAALGILSSMSGHALAGLAISTLIAVSTGFAFLA